jgi:hypothetical protein
MPAPSVSAIEARTMTATVKRARFAFTCSLPSLLRVRLGNRAASRPPRRHGDPWLCVPVSRRVCPWRVSSGGRWSSTPRKIWAGYGDCHNPCVRADPYFPPVPANTATRPRGRGRAACRDRSAAPGPDGPGRCHSSRRRGARTQSPRRTREPRIPQDPGEMKNGRRIAGRSLLGRGVTSASGGPPRG